MTTNWVKAGIVSYGDLSATGTTRSITVFTVPDDGLYEIEDVMIERMTDFSGGNISACTIEVGVSGSTASHMAASTDIFTGAKNTAVRTLGSSTSNVAGRTLRSASTAIALKATSVGANLNALAAGKLAVFVKIGRVPTTGA